MIEKVLTNDIILKQANKLFVQINNFCFLSQELSAFVSQTPITKHGQNLDYKCQFLPLTSQKLVFYRVLPLHLYLIIIIFLKYGCDLNFKVLYCVFQKLDF